MTLSEKWIYEVFAPISDQDSPFDNHISPVCTDGSCQIFVKLFRWSVQGKMTIGPTRNPLIMNLFVLYDTKLRKMILFELNELILYYVMINAHFQYFFTGQEKN